MKPSAGKRLIPAIVAAAGLAVVALMWAGYGTAGFEAGSSASNTGGGPALTNGNHNAALVSRDVLRTEEVERPTAISELVQVEPTTSREPAPLAAFHGQLRTAGGRPLRGATLSWSPYGQDLIALSSDLDLGPWTLDQATFETITLWAKSDDQGMFAFMEMPNLNDGDSSVIWATHPEATATPILLTPDKASWQSGKVHTLQPSPERTVVVIDEDGLGVEGATVIDVALVQPLQSVQTPLPLLELVRVFLRRSYITGSKGLATVAGMSGRRQLQANLGVHLSNIWKGPGGENAVLTLQPSFRVHGTLAISGSGTHAPGELYVLIEGQTGHQVGYRCRVSVDDETLQWGPIQVPIGDEDHFTFSLDAITLTPCTQTIPTPEPGAQTFIDLESEVGNEVWFRLVDKEGESLSEGIIEIDWESNDGRSGTFVRKLRADGYVRLLACPSGRVTHVRGHSPGYASGTIVGPEVPETEPAAWTITLQEAGSLRGTCTRNGMPVEDFEIVMWQTGNIRNPVRATFVDSEDGSFSVEEAPLGEVQVLATADGYGPSVPVLVRVEEGYVSEVKLELNPDRVIRGRVLDEYGDPLQSAGTVQAYIQAQQELISPAGDPVITDSSGGFELRGFAPGLMGIVISAPGYAPYEGWTRTGKRSAYEFGEIRLQSLRELQMKFHFADGTDATIYQVWIAKEGLERTAVHRLAHDGTTAFRDVGPETRDAWIRFPDGGTEYLKLPRPTAGAWIAEYQMAGSGSLVLEVGPDDSRANLSNAATVALWSYVHGSSQSSVRERLLAGSEDVEFSELLPGEYLAQVVDGGELVLGSALVTVLQGETTYAALDLDSGDSVFYVADRTGAPLAGVTVSLYATDLPLWRHGVTDTSGTCTIRGTTSMSAFAGLHHPIHGTAWDLSVDLAEGPDSPIELELDARESIRLRITDGGLAIPNVLCRVVSTPNPNLELVTAERSDHDGLIEFDGFAKGTYRLQLSGTHIWGKEVEVGSLRGSDVTPVQLRRLGNLRVHAQLLSGQPLSGLDLELIDSETGTPLSDWIQQGRVLTDPASAITNADGLVAFLAIPHGTYTWRVVLNDGGELSGTLQVSPGSWTDLAVKVAD